MEVDMYGRICTKNPFLHVSSTFRALLSTLRASTLWQLSKNHQKIHENWQKYVKNLLSLKWFLVMLNTFWTQKNIFSVWKSIFYYWVAPQRVPYLLHLSSSKFENVGKCHFSWKMMKIHQNRHQNFRWDMFE